ncbi:hypothetical protein H5410_003799 [Solanum commersonii]|uniref:DUF4216 domain-containing protein n=1 Tax=Solanum commersonii TaxID=4109 RepID=A0A9J6B650_SOLCO|nr:hypothetical protein H5410_003799 [Solanum commersonii]
MIYDAFGMHSDFEQGENVEEDHNEEANIFYEQLCDCSSPLFNGSQHSKLSVAVRLLSIKSDNNICQGEMDSMIDLMKELVDLNGSKKRTLHKLTEKEKKIAELHVLLNCPEVQPFLDYFVSQYGHDQVFPSFITWYTNWKYSKNKKTNNSGVWVKGDDGNQNENVDYFGVLQEILELEYSGWPIKRIVLFQCKLFDPTSRGTRDLKQHNIIEVKHTRKYTRLMILLLLHDKSDWWVVIKTKPMGVHQVVDAELEMNLEHPDHILEEVNREELAMPTNMEEDEEETFEEDEWIEEEETSEDDACEWIDDEETSEEDE